MADKKEALAQALFDHIPVGVGSEGAIKVSRDELDEILEIGIDWSIKRGHAWPEDKQHCEELGRMKGAKASAVSSRAKTRGLPQLGTLVCVCGYRDFWSLRMRDIVTEAMERSRRGQAF